MTITARSGAFGSTFTLALAGIAVRAVGLVVTALKNRAAVRSLHELDDRALKDIGLVRTDVTAALDTPLHLDPSRHLAEVAGGSRGLSKPAAIVTAVDAARLRRRDADVSAAGVVPRAA